MKTRILVGMLMLALAAGGCTEWQRNVTLNGVPFCRVTVRRDGFTVGLLSRDTVIEGRPCRHGWLHLHPNGVVAAFTSTEPIVIRAGSIPSESWIRQDARGAITWCSFPATTEMQGFACRGTGGPKGVTTAFYPSGALKAFYPARDVVIDGVRCRAGLVRGWIGLHENGRLQSCLLDEDVEREGRRYRRGRRLEFDADGRALGNPEPLFESFGIGG